MATPTLSNTVTDTILYFAEPGFVGVVIGFWFSLFVFLSVVGFFYVGYPIFRKFRDDYEAVMDTTRAISSGINRTNESVEKISRRLNALKAGRNCGTKCGCDAPAPVEAEIDTKADAKTDHAPWYSNPLLATILSAGCQFAYHFYTLKCRTPVPNVLEDMDINPKPYPGYKSKVNRHFDIRNFIHENKEAKDEPIHLRKVTFENKDGQQLNKENYEALLQSLPAGMRENIELEARKIAASVSAGKRSPTKEEIFASGVRVLKTSPPGEVASMTDPSGANRKVRLDTTGLTPQRLDNVLEMLERVIPNKANNNPPSRPLLPVAEVAQEDKPSPIDHPSVMKILNTVINDKGFVNRVLNSVLVAQATEGGAKPAELVETPGEPDKADKGAKADKPVKSIKQPKTARINRSDADRECCSKTNDADYVGIDPID